MSLDFRNLGQGSHKLLGTVNKVLLLSGNPFDKSLCILVGFIQGLLANLQTRVCNNPCCWKSHD